MRNISCNLRSNDGDCEARRVHAANGAEASRVGDLVALSVAAESLLGAGWAVSERSAYIARAAMCTVAGEDCDGNHSSAAEDVKEYSKKGEDGLSTEKAGQEDSEDGV